jgi:hypothetical protein
MRSGVDHSLAAATGTEAPAFAGKCHQQLVAAAVALEARETMLETLALQIVAKFLKHEFRQEMSAVAQMLGELRQMGLDDLIQRCQFRPMANLRRGCNAGQGGIRVNTFAFSTPTPCR